MFKKLACLSGPDEMAAKAKIVEDSETGSKPTQPPSPVNSEAMSEKPPKITMLVKQGGPKTNPPGVSIKDK